jgi:outer membrane immunogenic protein
MGTEGCTRDSRAAIQQGEKGGVVMKRIMLFGAVILAVQLVAAPLSGASAADLPVKAPMMAPVAPGPLWSGFFIGGNIGDAESHSTFCTDATVLFNCSSGAPLDVVTQRFSGLVGGGQTGYRFQFGNFVFGPEAMLDGMVNHTQTTDTAILPGFPGRTRTTTMKGLSSVTGDAGVAFDRFYLYGKGGWAITSLDYDANNTLPGGFDVKGSEYATGWTGGAGVEYMLPSGWSVGVEYNYYQFDPKNILNVVNTGGVTIPCTFCNFGRDTYVQTITARINVRVGPP